MAEMIERTVLPHISFNFCIFSLEICHEILDHSCSACRHDHRDHLFRICHQPSQVRLYLHRLQVPRLQRWCLHVRSLPMRNLWLRHDNRSLDGNSRSGPGNLLYAPKNGCDKWLPM